MRLRFKVGDRVVVANPVDGELSPAAQLYAGRLGTITNVNPEYVPFPYTVRFADGALAFAPDELTHESEALLATADLSSVDLSAPVDSDAVNHPGHYTWLNGLEVIDITRNFGFVRGNALKYLMRADHKGRTLEDLKKARWYLNYEIQQLEEETA